MQKTLKINVAVVFVTIACLFNGTFANTDPCQDAAMSCSSIDTAYISRHVVAGAEAAMEACVLYDSDPVHIV